MGRLSPPIGEAPDSDSGSGWQGKCSRPLTAAAGLQRVCRAWHRTSEVKVLTPDNEFILSETEGRSRRLGEGQGRRREAGSGGSLPLKGRDLRQSKSAGVRIGTGYEVWYVWGEPRLRSGKGAQITTKPSIRN